MKRLFRALIDEQGATAVEYAILLGLIVLVLLSSVALVGERSNGMWTIIQSSLTQSGALQ